MVTEADNVVSKRNPYVRSPKNDRRRIHSENLGVTQGMDTVVECRRSFSPEEIRQFNESQEKARELAVWASFGTIGFEGYLKALGVNPKDLRRFSCNSSF